MFPRPRETITAPSHKMGVWERVEVTLELLLFSNNRNEAILVMRMKPKEKEKEKNPPHTTFWCCEFHGIIMKIKEQMQKEDKEIRVSELLQMLPVAVPVPKAACHFSAIRSRFSGLGFFLFVLESS